MPKVVIAEDEFMNLDMMRSLADSGYDVVTLPGRCRNGSNSASGISPTLPPSIHTLLIAALSRVRRMDWANRFLPQTMLRTASHYNTRRCISVKRPYKDS
jgi:hypothetical protein